VAGARALQSFFRVRAAVSRKALDSGARLLDTQGSAPPQGSVYSEN